MYCVAQTKNVVPSNRRLEDDANAKIFFFEDFKNVMIPSDNSSIGSYMEYTKN